MTKIHYQMNKAVLTYQITPLLGVSLISFFMLGDMMCFNNCIKLLFNIKK